MISYCIKINYYSMIFVGDNRIFLISIKLKYRVRKITYWTIPVVQKCQINNTHPKKTVDKVVINAVFRLVQQEQHVLCRS